MYQFSKKISYCSITLKLNPVKYLPREKKKKTYRLMSLVNSGCKDPQQNISKYVLLQVYKAGFTLENHSL